MPPKKTKKPPKPPTPKVVAADAGVPPVAGNRIPFPTPIVVIHGGPASNLLDLYLTQSDTVFTLSRGGWPLHKPSGEQVRRISKARRSFGANPDLHFTQEDCMTCVRSIFLPMYVASTAS
jgi:hypothetical protein